MDDWPRKAELPKKLWGRMTAALTFRLDFANMQRKYLNIYTYDVLYIKM
jgi:hypothetical protein